jgi:hypothetical protein
MTTFADNSCKFSHTCFRVLGAAPEQYIWYNSERGLFSPSPLLIKSWKSLVAMLTFLQPRNVEIKIAAQILLLFLH